MKPLRTDKIAICILAIAVTCGSTAPPRLPTKPTGTRTVAPNMAATTHRVSPNVAGTPTPPPVSVVTQVCIPPQFQSDMVLGQWNYYQGYLYCQVHDANTGGDYVFKQNTNGSFSVVIKGGGHIDDWDMSEYWGIPSSIATPLYTGLHN